MMHTRPWITLTLLAVWACTDGNEEFGRFTPSTPEVRVDDVLEKASEYDGKPVRLSGKISRECPSGCWFYAEDASGEIRVELAGTDIVLPQRVGSDVTVEGKVTVDDDGVVQILGSAVRVR